MHDLIIIGGGQSALACGFYLRRTNLGYLILDDQPQCGGAWRQAWDSLSLFSTAEHSSLPGWMMPASKGLFPSKQEVVDYLCRYEKRYNIYIKRPVIVRKVARDKGHFTLFTSAGNYKSRAVISATGTWHKPFMPPVPGREQFKGTQVHSSRYLNPEPFVRRKVLIVGEGNSGAQILAEVSRVAETSWATAQPPRYLPDDIDGRVLFSIATAKYYAQQKGEVFDASRYDLGSIVMVPGVKDARARNVLESKGRFTGMYEEGVIWENGHREAFDAIIWCTGFGYATGHLEKLTNVDSKGKILTRGTHAINVPGLWLVGYGGWTGFASATLIGVGRSARQTIQEVVKYLDSGDKK